MTVPTEAGASNPAESDICTRSDSGVGRSRRRQGLLWGAVVGGVGFAVMVMSHHVPNLATPVATGAAVSAVLVPLAQTRMGSGGRRRREVDES
ncbi:hypothetical protein GCM10010387_07190 [Streptomyces inusitatus]|uniref:Uncharacterized protein n=1 Tax=Streptomyces inusitatus TaxID=68221 RepID=A0A918PNE2_9ACTN|nr:hypothetical protein GCM10010387_07190 [Streptomyces inusitatus]